MMDLMDVFPAPDFPISKTFFFDMVGRDFRRVAVREIQATRYGRSMHFDLSLYSTECGASIGEVHTPYILQSPVRPYEAIPKQ